jgi:hypothetical protein
MEHNFEKEYVLRTHSASTNASQLSLSNMPMIHNNAIRRKETSKL